MVVLHFQEKASQLKTERNNLQQQLSTRKVSEQRFHFNKNVSPFMYEIAHKRSFLTCRMMPRNWNKKRMIWNSNYWWSKYVTTKFEFPCICFVRFDMIFRLRCIWIDTTARMLFQPFLCFTFRRMYLSWSSRWWICINNCWRSKWVTIAFLCLHAFIAVLISSRDRNELCFIFALFICSRYSCTIFFFIGILIFYE